MKKDTSSKNERILEEFPDIIASFSSLSEKEQSYVKGVIDGIYLSKHKSA